MREVLRDPRLGSGVAAAAPAPSRTEKASPAFNSVVQENRGSPPTARAAVLVEKGPLELREFPRRAIRENQIPVRVEGCALRSACERELTLLRASAS